jgi:polyisoprenoid-binding protein YceI
VHLTIDAESLDAKQKKRDQHLRSGDFFDVERHAQVQFVSDRATLAGDHLMVHGQLHAAGKTIPLELDATLKQVTNLGGFTTPSRPSSPSTAVT